MTHCMYTPCSGHTSIWPDKPPHTHTHKHTQARSTHTHTVIHNTARASWGSILGNGDQIKWCLTKSNKMVSYKTQWESERLWQGGARNKRTLTIQRHIDPVSNSEWGLPAPEATRLKPQGTIQRGHPNYYPEKPGETGAIFLCLIYLHLGSYMCLGTNTPRLSRPPRNWKWIKTAFQTKDVIKSMPWTSAVFREVALVLIQNSFTLTLYTILKI